MVLKYEEGATAPYKLKANRELMMLQKVLLRDAVKTSQMKDLQSLCPLVGVEGTKRRRANLLNKGLKNRRCCNELRTSS